MSNLGAQKSTLEKILHEIKLYSLVFLKCILWKTRPYFAFIYSAVVADVHPLAISHGGSKIIKKVSYFFLASVSEID